MLLLLVGIANVSALTSNEVTYENEGNSETLTSTIDTLYSELKEYRTNGSVTSSGMLEGYTGYSKGKLISGSIPSKGSTTYTPGVNNQVITKGQYLSEDQVILGDANLVSENIKEGKEIFGIKGSIKDNSGKTLEITNTASDDQFTYLTIPEEAIYNTSSVVKIANSELLKDSWIDLTDQCDWAESVILHPSMDGWQYHRSSYVYYNKYTHQVIGMITTMGEVPNQSTLVVLPVLEGISGGINHFNGSVGISMHTDYEMTVAARIVDNTIISSHSMGRGISVNVEYMINFIAM